MNVTIIFILEIETEPEKAAKDISEGFDIGSPQIEDIIMSQDIFASPGKQGNNSPNLDKSPIR